MLKYPISLYSYILFFGLIGLLLPFGITSFYIAKGLKLNSLKLFQFIASCIFKVFFKLLPFTKVYFINRDNVVKNTNSTIFLASHESALDYPLIGSFISNYFVVTNFGAVKFLIIKYIANKMLGVKFFQKQNFNLKSIQNSYEELKSGLSNGINIIIFPEGTRSESSIKSFKKGAFKLSMETNTPIVPIVIDGTAKTLNKNTSLFSTSKNIIKVSILEAIYPNDFDNYIDYSNFTREVMQQEKERLNLL